MRLAGKRSREHTLTSAGALLGLLVGALLFRLLRLPASPDQPIGFARAQGFNPRGDMIGFLLLCLSTGGGALIGKRLAERSDDRLRAWAAKYASLPLWQRLGALLLATFAVMATLYRLPIRWQVAIDWGSWLALAALLPWLIRSSALPRSLGLATAAAHALTLWTFLAVPGAKLGLSFVSLGALLLVVSLLEGYWLGQRDLERGAPDLALSALLFPVAFWSHRTDAACVAAGLAAIVLPLVGALLRRWTNLRGKFLRWFAVTVFLPGSVAALGAAACLHGPPLASLFEDGHGLLPASEYLRGELPYKNIVPAHGLMSDGVIQAIELSLFGDNYRGISRGTKLVGALFWPAVYAVGFAASGSAAFGFWSTCVSFLFFPQFMFFRVMASLGCLALASGAARTGRPKAWLFAGAALPFALLFAVDFFLYACAAGAAALAVSRGPRKINAGRLLVGGAVAAAVIAIVFAVLGILRFFLHDTFLFLPRLFPVYALGIGPPPPSIANGFRSIELFGSLLDQGAFYYWFLPVALFSTAILLVRAPTVGARGRALLPLLVWFCAATPSVLERQHFGYPLFVAPTAALLLARWVKGYRPWRSPRGFLAGAIVAILLLMPRPFGLATAVVSGLASFQPPPGTVALDQPPRARGTLFVTEEAAAITAAGAFLQSGQLATGDTWLDFSNAPLLYYLFDRDCPIRFYEVPLYEAAADQQDVIAAVSRNSSVKAVLMRTGRNSDAIDGIPNDQRAPLVFQYIAKEFHPAFSKDGVEFWIRNSAEGEKAAPR